MRRAADIARAAGRSVHLLQWDVARLAFDTPAILARYPEIQGVTHAAVRIAAGRWAREAVRRWDEAHGARDLLLGETPLVGERFASLARRRDDAVEGLLASEGTLFLVPVPTAAVRERIETARARDMTAPLRDRDRASAAPHLVRWHWDDLVAVALELGVGPARPLAYDADLYARTFHLILARRHTRIVEIDEVLDVEGSARVVPEASEIVPTASEVAEAMASVEAAPVEAIDRAAAEWYRM